METLKINGQEFKKPENASEGSAILEIFRIQVPFTPEPKQPDKPRTIFDRIKGKLKNR